MQTLKFLLCSTMTITTSRNSLSHFLARRFDFCSQVREKKNNRRAPENAHAHQISFEVYYNGGSEYFNTSYCVHAQHSRIPFAYQTHDEYRCKAHFERVDWNPWLISYYFFSNTKKKQMKKKKNDEDGTFLRGNLRG